MPEFNVENPENRRGQSPEDMAALERAREQLQSDADKVLIEKEKAPQVPDRNFQVHPDSRHAQAVEQIVGQPVPPLNTHGEIPGMNMPLEITSADEKRQKLSEMIANPAVDILKPGGADDLQHKMEQSYSPPPEELKEAA